MPDNTIPDRPVPEVSPADFLGRIERGEPLRVLDVRSPDAVAGGRIELIPEAKYHNIPGSRILASAALDTLGLDPAIPVVVVCGRGNDSRYCAAHLNRLGARATSLAGGMSSWMGLAVPREIPPPPGLDRLVQFDRVGKGSLGYILVRGKEAIVIDPGRDARPYTDLLRQSAVNPVAVADTHAHADYLSGGASLSRALGVPYHLHPADGVSPYDGSPGRLDFRPLGEGMPLRLGGSAVSVLHTPGHSPGSVTFMIGRDAAFTGDFLFVASIGRPDIADRAEEWAGDLWRSLLRVKREWPAYLRVFPAHYASVGEKKEGGSVYGMFGDMLRENPSLQFAGEPEFRTWVRSNARPVPAAYRTIKEINLALIEAGREDADRLEAGKNECAISGASPSSSHF